MTNLRGRLRDPTALQRAGADRHASWNVGHVDGRCGRPFPSLMPTFRRTRKQIVPRPPRRSMGFPVRDPRSWQPPRAWWRHRDTAQSSHTSYTHRLLPGRGSKASSSVHADAHHPPHPHADRPSPTHILDNDLFALRLLLRSSAPGWRQDTRAHPRFGSSARPHRREAPINDRRSDETCPAQRSG